MKGLKRMKIETTAFYVPERIVKNETLEASLHLTPEWIEKRTGIQERRIVQAETATEMAVNVAEALLDQADIDASTLDFIIVATMTPDTLTPGIAQTVQGRLHATQAFAWDLNASYAGVDFGLSMVNALLKTGRNRGLIIGAEVMSRLVNWEDANTAILFGDGAAGVLVSDQSESQGIIGESLRTFGEEGAVLRTGLTAGSLAMNGQAVYRFATRQVPVVIKEAVTQAQLNVSDIDAFILHQANERIIKSIAKQLKLPLEKLPMNIAKYGNTGSADIGILLSELVASGQVQAGDKVVLAGFGGGMSAAAIVVQL